MRAGGCRCRPGKSWIKATSGAGWARPNGAGCARAAAQPYGTLTQPVRLTNPAREALPKTAIWRSLTLAQVQELIEDYPAVCSELTKPGWQVLELPTGHWPMFSRPRDLADLLARLA
ncbi:MAG: hypothetical protein IT318_07190 [Anaerolineales bacterium]|nr:hypothetical protein [Anaerolineales bacterium]